MVIIPIINIFKTNYYSSVNNIYLQKLFKNYVKVHDIVYIVNI